MQKKKSILGNSNSTLFNNKKKKNNDGGIKEILSKVIIDEIPKPLSFPIEKKDKNGNNTEFHIDIKVSKKKK